MSKINIDMTATVRGLSRAGAACKKATRAFKKFRKKWNRTAKWRRKI